MTSPTFGQDVFDVDGAEAAACGIVAGRDAESESLRALRQLNVQFLADLARADRHEGAGPRPGDRRRFPRGRHCRHYPGHRRRGR